MGRAWDDARRTAYDAAPPLPPATRPVGEALGLRLAAPLVARDDLPRFDNAAMDGYAVSGAGPWRLRGTTLAGGPPAETPLRTGEAWRVATGSPLPPGTTAVLRVEHAVEHAVGEGHVVTGDAEPGRHVRRRGEEAVHGEKVLPAGVVVTPQVVALAAAIGVAEVAVTPGGRVAALVTGDEVAEPSRGAPAQGAVRDAIGPALPGWVGWAGGSLVATRRVPDGARALAGALDGARRDADLVVVTGSSSVGPADHLRDVLAALDATPVVDRIACRPGSLAGLWRLPDGVLVAGLPGNPLAALVAFLAVAAPALAGLRGDPLPPLGAAGACPPGLSRHPTECRLVPVRLTDEGPVALDHVRSGMLRGVARADALAVVPPDGGPVALQPLPR